MGFKFQQEQGEYHPLQDLEQCFLLFLPKNVNIFRLSRVGTMFCRDFQKKGLIGHRCFTPRKFNIDPEKWWLEDYFPIGKVTFQGLC